MKVISHRGFWTKEDERNSYTSFRRSFELGIGTETDIRDSDGTVCVAHDPPVGATMALGTFLDLAVAYSIDFTLTIALNIKADGLADFVKLHLDSRPNLDCFVFDMSIPDMRSYLIREVPVFTRMSEVEPNPVWLKQSAGVWLDSFDSIWYNRLLIQSLLDRGKRVCVVSEELHGRDSHFQWQMLKQFSYDQNVLLCTDNPQEAIKFFS